MNFDYFSCIQHKVVVDGENFEEHKKCDKLGEFFEVKIQKKKIFSGLISRKLVNEAKEKLNIEKFKAIKERNIHKKKLAQDRFQKQINDGDIIVNLLEMKI